MNNSRMDLNKAIKLALEILKSILSYFKITLRKTSFWNIFFVSSQETYYKLLCYKLKISLESNYADTTAISFL